MQQPWTKGKGDPDNLSVAFIFAAAGAAIVALVLVLIAYYNVAEDRLLEQRVVAQPDEGLQQIRAEQLDLLGSYRWVDREQGIVGIPIDRAMDLVIAEHRGEETEQ